VTDLALSDEQETLRASARAFLRGACTPELVRRARAPDGDGHDVDLWRGMAQLGWLGLAFPESIGGGGGGLLDLAVLYEEGGRVLVPTTLYSTVEAALLIDRAGDDRQRTGLLRPVFAGERTLALALHEEGMPSSPGALATTATMTGDAVVVDGRKQFVPNGGVADDLVVVARDPERPAPAPSGWSWCPPAPRACAGPASRRLPTMPSTRLRSRRCGCRWTGSWRRMPGRLWSGCAASQPPSSASRWSAVRGPCST
jgi:alkylation response protein AidB-like acyl-CoA dehydrogenase